MFGSRLDSGARAVGKTDRTVAGESADLREADLREWMFRDIEAEYERDVELVSEITWGESRPLSGWLAESLSRRNPYVDPLNLLQVELLGTDERTEAEERALRLTVKGIAAGMKNTG